MSYATSAILHNCYSLTNDSVLKPNKVSSMISYIYEKFLSHNSSDRAYIYTRIYDFSYARKFLSIALRTWEFAYAKFTRRNWRTNFHE